MKSNVFKVRTLTVSDPGDLAAPPGSQPWAIAVRLKIQSLLKDNATSVKHLRTWLQAIEEHTGYGQLTDEHGENFSSYAAFCSAKPPWGLGCPLDVIDQITKEFEFVQAKHIQEEKKELRSWGDLDEYLERFSKLVQNFPDNQPINSSNIGQVLETVPSNAHIWRKRWLDLGWIEPIPEKKRGCYQITNEGRKLLQEWLEQTPYNNQPLWLNIPRRNPTKAADQLIKSLDAEHLRELYNLIGESLNQDCNDINKNSNAI